MRIPFTSQSTRSRHQVRSATINFPSVRIVNLTWSIPDEFGGLTSVLLRRSKLIAELGSIDIPVLTLDPKLNVAAKTESLRTRDLLGRGVQLRNCWTEVAAASHVALDRIALSTQPVPTKPPTPVARSESAGESNRRVLYDSGDNIVGVEHLRANGSVYIRDERKDPRGRGVILCDSSGGPIGAWTRMRDFYFAWIDSVVGSNEAIIINDSEFVGSFFRHYQRPNVRAVQVFHNTHLQPAASTPFGPLTRTCREISVDHAQFDVLTFLTRRQQNEFRQAFQSSCRRTRVIPNSRITPEQQASHLKPRHRDSGIMLARLTKQKRVDQAIRAFAQLGETSARLDVFGSGPDASELEALIDAYNLRHSVRLRGYSADTTTQLESASFLVLSSDFEGFGLVLVEAMAAGCIPIAFDVRYGPSDIITHGRDGFLVPPGDAGALAQTIRQFLDLSDEERTKMRHAAIRSARRFDDAAVTRMWADLCYELVEPVRRPIVAGRPARLSAVSLQESTVVLHGMTAGDWTSAGADVFLRVRSRSGFYGFEVPIDLHADESFNVLIPLGHFLAAPPDTYDFWLTAAGAQQHRRMAVAKGADLAVSLHVGRFFETERGNLSLAIEPARL